MPKTQVHPKQARPEETRSDEADKIAERDTEAAAAREPVTVEVADSWLDEIDSLLEENAQDFLNGYVQRGGQ